MSWISAFARSAQSNQEAQDLPSQGAWQWWGSRRHGVGTLTWGNLLLSCFSCFSCFAFKPFKPLSLLGWFDCLTVWPLDLFPLAAVRVAPSSGSLEEVIWHVLARISNDLWKDLRENSKWDLTVRVRKLKKEWIENCMEPNSFCHLW